MKEAQVKKAIKAILNKLFDEGYPVHAVWPVQAGIGSSLLDCLVCVDGTMVWIEVKGKGGKLTKRQADNLLAWKQAQATTLLVTPDNIASLRDALLRIYRYGTGGYLNDVPCFVTTTALLGMLDGNE